MKFRVWEGTFSERRYLDLVLPQPLALQLFLLHEKAIKPADVLLRQRAQGDVARENGPTNLPTLLQLTTNAYNVYGTRCDSQVPQAARKWLKLTSACIIHWDILTLRFFPSGFPFITHAASADQVALKFTNLEKNLKHTDSVRKGSLESLEGIK